MNKELKIPFICAVYGSLRKPYGNHRVLKDSEFLGTFKTEEKFNLYSLGAFPCITLNGETNITVELYKITDPKIAVGLDCLEGYPSFYNRKITSIIDNPFPEYDIWIYFIDNENYSDRKKIEHGDWNLFKLGHE